MTQTLKKRILITGSLAFDYIMDFNESFEKHILPDKLKTLSVSFILNKLSRNFGGVAGNIAYNLSLINTNCSILASCGEKDSEFYLKHFKKHNIDTSLINVVKESFTANAFMITDKNNCQISGFYKGALEKDSGLLLPAGFDLMIIGATLPTAMVSFAKQAKKLELPYIFAPGQEITRFLKKDLLECINGSFLTIANDYEMALITKKAGLSKKQLLRKTKILITTLGNYGSLIKTKNETIKVGTAKPNRVLDPTGAGDSYIAGFAAGLLQNCNLRTCGQIGANIASYAIEQYGTQNHTLDKNIFSKRYERFFTDKLCYNNFFSAK